MTLPTSKKSRCEKFTVKNILWPLSVTVGSQHAKVIRNLSHTDPILYLCCIMGKVHSSNKEIFFLAISSSSKSASKVIK